MALTGIYPTQSNQNAGTGGQVGQGIGRDVNASLGALDLSNFGAATSSATATSGAVTTGDRIIGGKKAIRQFGIVKMLALFAGGVVLFKLYKKMRG